MARIARKTNGKAHEKPTLETNNFSRPPRSLGLFEAGITTGHQFAAGMSALMSDVISGSVTPQIANAVCNAGGKLLKVVEMSHRWGKRDAGSGGEQVLKLSE